MLDKCSYPGIARLYFTFQDEANLYLGLELCHNGALLSYWPSNLSVQAIPL